MTPLKYQKGAATLLTAVILLIAITMVTFITAKTVLMETKMVANNHRTSQAIASAEAGMDYALAYFDDGGFDHDGDGLIERSHDGDGNTTYTDTDNAAAGFSPPERTTIVFFNKSSIYAGAIGPPAPHPCVDSSLDSLNNQKSALIQVTGTSDDGTANRTLYQCVGTRNILKGGGPKQTLVSGSVVDLTGSAQIINRYNDLNVWSAGASDIAGAAMKSYIRPPAVELADLTADELTETPQPAINNAQQVSSGGTGAGTDIYQVDSTLAAAKTVTDASATGDGPGSFFDLFFYDTFTDLSDIADSTDQKFATGADATDLNGLGDIVYVDGDASLVGGGNTIGSSDSSAIIIVDGDFTFNGGTIYGMVYVTGTLTMAGGATVVGSLIAEDGVDMGSGTSSLVYAPNSHGDPEKRPLRGTTGIVSGSWRDW